MATTEIVRLRSPLVWKSGDKSHEGTEILSPGLHGIEHAPYAAGGHTFIEFAGGEEKCRWALEHGADACVDYRTEDFRSVVRSQTGGDGVDYVLESVGGEVFDHSLQVLAPMGRLVLIGFSSIDKTRFRATVEPNCRLITVGRLHRFRERLFTYQAQGFVDGKVVFEGLISGMVIETREELLAR